MNDPALSLDSTLEALASESPAPGGGYAAALAGALGASLAAMAARISAKGTADDTGWQERIQRGDALVAELRGLADHDARAYEKLSLAWKLPRGDALERAARDQALDLAARGAIEVPLAIAAAGCEVAELGLVAIQEGSKALATDAAAAGELAAAAVRAAGGYVAVNLSAVQDAEQRLQWRQQAAACVTRAEATVESLRRELAQILEA